MDHVNITPEAYVISRGSLGIVFSRISTMIITLPNPCATVPRISRYVFMVQVFQEAQSPNIQFWFLPSSFLRILLLVGLFVVSHSILNQVSTPSFMSLSEGAQRSQPPSATLQRDDDGNTVT